MGGAESREDTKYNSTVESNKEEVVMTRRDITFSPHPSANNTACKIGEERFGEVVSLAPVYLAPIIS